MRTPLWTLGLLAAGALSAAADDAPVELGRVAWERDFAAAEARARKEEKPLLVLFDEVPGCSTCKQYGSRVLSHPLIVDAAETLFVPAAVFNNRGGDDRVILERFGEPSWNNPVVRILAPDAEPLGPRLAGNYTVEGLAQAMLDALAKRERAAPSWLRQLGSAPLARATFGMHCFWEGEVRLGALEGVRETKTGWLGGTEVVELTYDPQAIDYAKLLAQAQAMQCATQVFTHSAQQLTLARQAVGERAVPHPGSLRPTPGDDVDQLQHSPLRFVPMTRAQATKVNAALGRKQDPLPHLAPSQRAVWRGIEAHPDAGWRSGVGAQDLGAALAAARAKLAELDPR
ncbi:MAG: VPGUxxT family thioredoxin-like (seleno)protein, type 2 [Planctomycetota bacterium]